MEHNTPNDATENELRKYFRVQTQALLQIEVLDEEQLRRKQLPASFQHDAGYSLMQQLRAVEQEQHALLHRISEVSRDLEHYLQLSHKKFDLLASALACQLQQQQHQHREAQDIVLSEGGIAFHSSRDFPVGASLALQIFLLPGYASLGLFAKVIECTADQDSGDFLLSCDFINHSDADRQILAKHIMQVQLLQRRQSLSED